MDNIVVTSDGLGTLWTIGWLFTIGYLRLSFGRALLGIIVWPYYIGKHFHKGHVA